MSGATPPLPTLSAALGKPLDEELVARLGRLVELLAGWDRGMNLIGESDRETLWLKHIADCLLYARAVGDFQRLVDVGSGNGLPGLVLACAHPQAAVCLLESSARRCDFLREAATRLDLPRVDVVHARAEEAGHQDDLRGSFAVAVARRVAPLAVLLEFCQPLLAPGGRAVLSKGRGLENERREAEAVPELLGGRWAPLLHVTCPPELVAAGLPPARRYVVVEQMSPVAQRYPRRSGRPAKRPLGASQ